MKKIYPNFYDVVPIPMNGYILFQCPSCQTNFMYYAKEIGKNKHKCPYCGSAHTLNNFYQNAYQAIYQYHHMISIKNLLELIGVKVNILEKETKNGLSYRLHFIKREQPDEAELKQIIEKAFLVLQEKVKEKSIEYETKIHIYMKDVVNTKDYIKIIMPCCENPLMIRQDHKYIKHCIYCQHEFK